MYRTLDRRFRCSRVGILSLVVLAAVAIVIYYLWVHETLMRPTHLVVPGEIDFGDITEGTKHRRTLDIHNPTDRAITVTHVGSHCVCTIPSLVAPCTIAAGSRLRCEIVLDARGMSGATAKIVEFHTDDTVETPEGDKTVVFVTRVVAHVATRREPTVVPAVLEFGRFGTWESPSRNIRVYGRGVTPLEVFEPQPFSPGIGLEIGERLTDYTTVMVSLETNPDEGEFAHSQTLDTSDGIVRFIIRGDRRSGLYLENDLLVFGRNGNGSVAAMRKVLVVHHHPAIEPSTLRFSMPSWRIAVERVEAIGVAAARLEVTVSEEAVDVRSDRGTLTLLDPNTGATTEAQFVVRDAG